MRTTTSTTSWAHLLPEACRHTTAYESPWRIFVPGKFFTAEKKGGDTYSCTHGEREGAVVAA